MKNSLVVLTLLLPHLAAADPPPPIPTAPPPPPAPYSLPWQMRSVIPATVLRSDTSIAPYDSAAGTSVTAVSILTFSYKLTSGFAPLVRIGSVSNWPKKGDEAVAFLNPVIGGMYGFQFNHGLRLALYLCAVLPFGQGGGNTPSAAVQAADTSGIWTRAALENALFAPNFFTVLPGIDFAWVFRGLTLQLEASLLQLIRVRGETLEKDDGRTNLIVGLHVGYFIIPALSIAAELRNQSWLTTPAAVAADSSKRDTLTLAAGVRGHFKVSQRVWFRPGLSYTRGFTGPMNKLNYNVVQIDLPLQF